MNETQAKPPVSVVEALCLWFALDSFCFGLACLDLGRLNSCVDGFPQRRFVGMAGGVTVGLCGTVFCVWLQVGSLL